MRITALFIALTAAIPCSYTAGTRARSEPPKVMIMKATAYTNARQPTASGAEAHEGIVAADPAVVPLGTRIRITGTEAYDGSYLVADTGLLIKGRRIDVYLSSLTEAKEFGVKRVRVEIEELGTGRADARSKDDADLSRVDD